MVRTEAVPSTVRWTPSRTPGDDRPPSIASAFSSPHFPHAQCVPGPFSCIKFPTSSSARTKHSQARRNFSARAAFRSKSCRTSNASGSWRSSSGAILSSGTKTSERDVNRPASGIVPTRMLADPVSVTLLNSLGRESPRLSDAHWAKADLAGVSSARIMPARRSDGGKESLFEEA